MARQLRIEEAGLTYHVWARGNARMSIYLDAPEFRRFLDILGSVFDSHDIACHAYCLMPNHYHLVITTNQANLSHAIQRVNSPYAEWWNDRHSRAGHVFQGRFGAQVVQDETYLLTVSRYVVLNPVRAHLVPTPDQWPWSSYRATAGLRAGPPFLDPCTLWQRFGATESEATRRRYREFVSMSEPGQDAPPCDPILGDEAFVTRFQEHRDAASIEVPKRDRLVRPPIARLFVGADGPADRMTSIAAARAAGYSLSEIAQILNVNRSTVSRIIARTTAAQFSDCGKESTITESAP